MGSLLLLTRKDGLLPALAGAIFPDLRVEVTDESDPLRGLEADAPRLVVIDLEARPPLAEAFLDTARHRFPDTPIVVLYGAEQREAAARAVIAGADATLACPYHLEELAALLARHVDRPALRESAQTPPPLPAAPPAASSSAVPRPHLSPPPAAHPSTLDAPPPGTEIADLDALSVFVRGLAHEINNPLTTIRGFLQLLLHAEGERAPTEETREAYETMESESRRIAAVIQELEYFSGTRRPARTYVDLLDLVESALENVDLEQIQPRHEREDFTLLADREQLFLALCHLFGYLQRSAPRNPPEITVELERDETCFRVIATGRAAAASQSTPERLLIPLYAGQGGDAGPRRSLAAVFGIARSHGGSLRVGRERDDRLVFRMEVPRRFAG